MQFYIMSTKGQTMHICKLQKTFLHFRTQRCIIIEARLHIMCIIRPFVTSVQCWIIHEFTGLLYGTEGSLSLRGQKAKSIMLLSLVLFLYSISQTGGKQSVL